MAKTTEKETIKEEAVETKERELEKGTDVEETTEKESGSAEDSENKGKPEEKESKEKEGFLSKAKKKAKKALPYVGAAVAGAAVTAGAIVVAVVKHGNNADNLAIEKDEDLIPADDFIEGEYSVEETDAE